MEKGTNVFLIVFGVILIVITLLSDYLRKNGGGITLSIWVISFAMIISGMLNPDKNSLIKRLILTIIFCVIATIVFWFILWGISSGWKM